MALTIQQEAQQKRAEAAAAPVTRADPTLSDVALPLVAPIPFAGEVVIYEDDDET
ncbi:MAG: hypothetical protein HC929_22210, partial [Leptolyngbyaceae cyanobacterium SM2_5_2]|nr:hypothetical protein [Leptolyngbyaceae cyanobacterium SM2_5_2]